MTPVNRKDITLLQNVLGTEFADRAYAESMEHSPYGQPNIEMFLVVSIKNLIEDIQELKKQIEELKNGK